LAEGEDQAETDALAHGIADLLREKVGG